MKLFKKKYKLSDEAKEYISKIKEFIATTNDENKLNEIFTEITILRMKLDEFDGIIGNYRDLKKRKEDLTKKGLIISQLNDICEDYLGYSMEDKQLVDDVMNRIIPKPVENQVNNQSISWWDKIWGNYDKATGKKK